MTTTPNHPEKLGKYEIQGVLGKGAMGAVYKGLDPILNRHVAIKVIADALDNDPQLVERFRREAMRTAQLNHPNIVTVYDFVEEENNLYIVMELLEGQDLKQLIKGGQPLIVDELLSIMEQIADGLGFAHENGIVHRDLKPAPIPINKKGQVKILDFGLVYEASSEMTKTGQVMGTPNYMSPEQVQGFKVDSRSDVFSLGAVFYELLTRQKPFSADSIHATMYKVVQGERAPLSSWDHVPAPMVEVIERALHPQADERFRDGNELRLRLKVLRGELVESLDSNATITGNFATPIFATGSGSHPSRASMSAVASGSAPSTSTPSTGGTVREQDASVAPASSTAVLYAGIGGLVVALAVVGFVLLRGGGDDAGPSVEALSEALVESQEALMHQSLDQHQYQAAMDQASELLDQDPANEAALRVQSEVEQALSEIEANVEAARSSLEAGDTQAAAAALGVVLALDPSHPLGAELSGELNEHFQSSAEEALTRMTDARDAASRAGASGLSEFRRAEGLREEASELFNRGEYTGAAQKYLSARGLYAQAQASQASQAARAEAEAREAADAAREAELEAARREEQQQAEAQQAALQSARDDSRSAWTREVEGLDAEVRTTASFERASAEAERARGLEGQGNLNGAADAYAAASSHLDAARREHAEAVTAREEAQRQAAAAAQAPTTTAPSRVDDEAAIRRVLDDYVRALETKDLALFQRVKPNLTADEQSRLESSFQATDSHDVELAISSIDVSGDAASVDVTRQDTVVIRGRSQSGESRSQRFVLAKSGGSWTITEIGR